MYLDNTYIHIDLQVFNIHASKWNIIQKKLCLLWYILLLGVEATTMLTKSRIICFIELNNKNTHNREQEWINNWKLDYNYIETS